MTSTPAMHILLVEDQLPIASNVAEYMEAKGYVFDFATTGDQGLMLALENYYDVIVLDLNLPGMDGLNVCQQIRANAQRHIPILMLTARDSIDDKVSGFHSGTDDYLTKPFSLEELEVRCLALARRHQLHTQDCIKLGPLELNRKRKTVSRDGTVINVSTMGYRIINVLMVAFPQVVSRSELSHKLWGDEPTESDALRSHIYQLRNVLDKPFEKPLLKTVFGVGFSLKIDEQGPE